MVHKSLLIPIFMLGYAVGVIAELIYVHKRIESYVRQYLLTDYPECFADKMHKHPDCITVQGLVYCRDTP